MPSKRKGKTLQKLLVIISKTLGSLVMICVILVLIPLSLPRLLGYETYDVISESMEPAIPVGSLIFVKQVPCDSLREGDVIAFYHNATIVSHRVVLNNYFEEKITTKGDANKTEDIDDVLYDQIIGKVTKHIPYMGTIGAYFSSPSGKLLFGELIICSVLLFVVADKIEI